MASTPKRGEERVGKNLNHGAFYHGARHISSPNSKKWKKKEVQGF
jgi:hypothetical protein